MKLSEFWGKLKYFAVAAFVMAASVAGTLFKKVIELRKENRRLKNVISSGCESDERLNIVSRETIEQISTVAAASFDVTPAESVQTRTEQAPYETESAPADPGPDKSVQPEPYKAVSADFYNEYIAGRKK